jgi:hypothetical protein
MTTSVAQLLVEKKIQPKVESFKLQASGLTGPEGYYRIQLERNNMDKETKEITKAYDAAHQLNRIASAIEEILRLVKKDMEPRTKEKD